jgi:hypothetical protein
MLHPIKTGVSGTRSDCTQSKIEATATGYTAATYSHLHTHLRPPLTAGSFAEFPESIWRNPYSNGLYLPLPRSLPLPERWLQMICPFCRTQLLPGASVCTGCRSYLSSQARTPFVLLAIVGYCWLEYEAYMHKSLVGLLLTRLGLDSWMHKNPFLGLSVIFLGIVVVVPWVVLTLLFKLPMLNKPIWVWSGRS